MNISPLVSRDRTRLTGHLFILFDFQAPGALPYVTYQNTLIGLTLGRLPGNLKSFEYISYVMPKFFAFLKQSFSIAL